MTSDSVIAVDASMKTHSSTDSADELSSELVYRYPIHAMPMRAKYQPLLMGRDDG